MAKLTILGDPSKNTDYPLIDSIHRIAIFPPIGIARVGDSDIECFLAPEVSGSTSPPNGLWVPGPQPWGSQYKFRDAHQKLRRQAVRFRVYVYDSRGMILGELNKKNGHTLTWTVDVANKKAANVVFPRGGRFGPSNTALRNPEVQPNVDLEKRSRLIVNAKEDIESNNTGFVPLIGTFQGSQIKPVDIKLAQLQIDDAGRLVFVPGTGDARSIASPGKPKVISEFDNVDWIDETCDGSVSVVVKKGNDTVLSAPPNFAWGINGHTTLYDVMENIYHKPNGVSAPEVEFDFWKHIWPVLLSASSISWTNNTALQGHGQFGNGHFEAQKLLNLFKGADTSKKEERKHFKSRIFEKLRKPLDEANPDHSQANVRYMPLVSGDAGDMVDPGNFPGDLQPNARRFAALTKLQYKRFEIWKEDDGFHLADNAQLPIPEPNLEKIKLENQPEELTRAILESTTGDPLYPGLEMYWIAKLETTYNIQSPEWLNPPFRINDSILPGHLTRGLSLPWQCDFDLCETHWWPATRPDDVVPKVVFDATVQTTEDYHTAITTRSKWN